YRTLCSHSKIQWIDDQFQRSLIFIQSFYGSKPSNVQDKFIIRISSDFNSSIESPASTDCPVTSAHIADFVSANHGYIESSARKIGFATRSGFDFKVEDISRFYRRQLQSQFGSHLGQRDG